jgi:hypothetical protein
MNKKGDENPNGFNSQSVNNQLKLSTLSIIKTTGNFISRIPFRIYLLSKYRVFYPCL